MEELTHKVSYEDVGQRLDAFWQSVLEDEGITRSRIQDWIKNGLATINGQPCTKASTKLKPGQTLRLTPEMPEADIVPVEGDLDVVFADEHLAVINKDAGLTVHPAPSVQEPTLVHIAAHHFPELLDQPGERPGIVHRLDKDTSGLIILALTDAARVSLTHAFADRDVFKEYLALVQGVAPESGRIALSMGRHPSIKTRMAVVDRGGRYSESLFQRVWVSPDKSASLVRVHILTGRTHQIRVHMAHIGHPILGDGVYAPADVAARAPRQMLHAWQVRLDHPDTGEELEFSVEPPADFMDTLADLCRERVLLGLTGVTGSGKSTVRSCIEEEGVPVFCADRIVGESYRPGGEGAAIIGHHFGQRFLDAQGGVDKSLLFAAMSESESMRREIERLIHPLVRHAMEDFATADGPALRVAEIPLLFEAGLHGATGMTAVVFCPDSSRLPRLQARGWNEERIRRTDAWQWSQSRKVAAADLVIDNSGSLDELRDHARALVSVVSGLMDRRAQRQLEPLCDLFSNPDLPDEMDVPDVSPAR